MIFRNVFPDSVLDINSYDSIFAIILESVIETLCVTFFHKFYGMTFYMKYAIHISTALQMCKKIQIHSVFKSLV